MIFFEKTKPGPAALLIESAKSSGSYRLEEVYSMLKADFKNKCYLCEIAASTSINIEHFVPHRGDLAKKFDWDNLFLACVHCNSTKHDKPEFDDILNCTIATDEAELAIRHTFEKDLFWEKLRFEPMRPSQRVANTIALLDEIHNGTTAGKRLEADNLRMHIFKELKRFSLLLERFLASDNADEKADCHGRLARKLSNESPFTAFKRWIIRDDAGLMLEFQDFL